MRGIELKNSDAFIERVKSFDGVSTVDKDKVLAVFGVLKATLALLLEEGGVILANGKINPTPRMSRSFRDFLDTWKIVSDGFSQLNSFGVTGLPYLTDNQYRDRRATLIAPSTDKSLFLEPKTGNVLLDNGDYARNVAQIDAGVAIRGNLLTESLTSFTEELYLGIGVSPEVTRRKIRADQMVFCVLYDIASQNRPEEVENNRFFLSTPYYSEVPQLLGLAAGDKELLKSAREMGSAKYALSEHARDGARSFPLQKFEHLSTIFDKPSFNEEEAHHLTAALEGFSRLSPPKP